MSTNVYATYFHANPLEGMRGLPQGGCESRGDNKKNLRWFGIRRLEATEQEALACHD